MASLSDYIKGLQSDYAKDNIYTNLAGSVLGANLGVQGASPWANFGINLAKGLVGGGLQSYGQSQNREYNAGINSVFGNVLSGRPVSPVEGLDDEDISALTNSANIFKTERANDVGLAAIEQGIKSGTITADGTGGVKYGSSIYTPDQLKSLGLGPDASKEQVALALDLMSKKPKPENPLDLKLKLNDEVTKAGNFLKTGIGDQYAKIKPNFDSLIANIDVDTGAGDIALLNAYQKVVDEGGVVRGEDIKQITDAQGYLESLFGKASNALTGEGRLKPEARLKLLEAAIGKVNSTGSTYLDLVNKEKSRLEGLQPGLGSQVSALDYKPFDYKAFLGERIKKEYVALAQQMGTTAARAAIKQKYPTF